MPSVPPNGGETGEPESHTSPAELLPPVDGPHRRVRASERRVASGPRHRSWGQRIVLSVLVVAVLGASAAAALVGYGIYKYEQVERVEVALAARPAGEPVNFLVVGSDTRDTLDETSLDTAGFNGEGAEGSGQRSDTIMVVRADPAQASVDILSFPRDLWVEIADTGNSQRINTAYAEGPQRLIDTIELNFDIPIHHYVEVDFAGFAGLVDAVGGVPMWFDAPVRDTHSGLRVDQEGCTVLDPAMALALARSRHLEYRTDDGWTTDGTGDLGRITRQQVFLRRAMDQVRTLGLDDAGTLRRLIDVGVESVSIDHGLGLDEMIDFGRRFGATPPEEMRTYALPVTPWRTSGGAAVLRVEEDQAQPMLNVFRGLPADTVFPEQVEHVVVLNGTGVDGQAGEVGDALAEIGFGIDSVGDVDEEAPLVHTRIRFAPGAERMADLVRRHLTGGAEMVVDAELDADEVVVETGQDFTTIGRRAAEPDAVSEQPPTTMATTSTGDASEASTADETTSTTNASEATTTTTEALGYAPDPDSTCT
jgi:polyisoprenyl-teichoic acid--peptidoglycan teichoic acid transferase